MFAQSKVELIAMFSPIMDHKVLQHIQVIKKREIICYLCNQPYSQCLWIIKINHPTEQV